MTVSAPVPTAWYTPSATLLKRKASVTKPCMIASKPLFVKRLNS